MEGGGMSKKVKFMVVQAGYSIGPINYSYEGDSVDEAIGGLLKAFADAQPEPPVITASAPPTRKRKRKEPAA
jgi:hypothetical protein